MIRILLFIALALNIMSTSAQTNKLKMHNPTDANTYYLSTQRDYFIPFYLKETGTQFSSAVKYSYTINNGTPIKQSGVVNHNGGTINCVNAIGLSMYRIAFTTPLHFNTVGSYTVKVWIDSINGLPYNTTDTLVRKYKTLNNLPPRKNLAEYYYHVACGPCGQDGTPYFEHLLDSLSEYSIPVKLHNSYNGPAHWAIMDRPEVQQLEDTLGIIGHPNFDNNRASLMPFDNSNHYYPYLGFCPLKPNYLTTDVIFMNKVPCDLSISNVTLNNNTNVISFTANAKFLDAQIFSNNVRIGCMLVEDSIFDFQANSNTSPIDSVFHRYVLRNAYGGTFGKPNSVPASVTANQVVTFNVTDTIPSNCNKSRLHLIPTIQYYNATTDNYEVLNVRRFSVKELLNTSGIANLQRQIKLSVYPNPANDNLTIESNMTGANLNITIMDMVGRKVLSTTIKNQKTSTISISSLASGTYVIAISDGDETLNRQLVIQ